MPWKSEGIATFPYMGCHKRLSWNALKKWRDCDRVGKCSSSFPFDLKCPEKVKGLRHFIHYHSLPPFSWNALKKWRDCDERSCRYSANPLKSSLEMPWKCEGIATQVSNVCWLAFRERVRLKCPEKVKGLRRCFGLRRTWTTNLETPWKSEGIATLFWSTENLNNQSWNALKKWRDCDLPEPPKEALIKLEMPWKRQGIATLPASG